MSKFKIKGETNLNGEIKVKGAKNSALKIIPATILLKNTVIISNLPQIEDVDKSLSVLKELGGQIKKTQDTLGVKNQVEINTNNIKKNILDSDLAKKFRSSIMFTGPLLAKFGEVHFPHPGGCVIGAGGRPIDIFIEGFKTFGAKLIEKDKYYTLKVKKLKGATYFFPKISVTATESMIMTATLAEGETILKNCAIEPEIASLIKFLNNCGAKIKGAETPTIKIIGVKELTATNFSIMPDRIETGSFAIMAATTKSELIISNCIPEHIRILLTIFDKIGINYEEEATKIKILKSKNILPYSIKTHEYPGFPTDLQQPYTILMTQANGMSMIHETIYDRRLFYADMLLQMGANITLCDPHRIIVNGPTQMHGMSLTSPDLRAGIALIIAGLVAKGTTIIDNIYQIERGYENIDSRLRNIGANIEKIS